MNQKGSPRFTRVEAGFAPILIILILAAALAGGYLLYQKQIQPKTIINPDGYNGPPSEKILRLKSDEECRVDKQLCNLLSIIQKNVTNGDYSFLLNLQQPEEKTCGGLFASVCKGAKDGEIRKGYVIGPQGAEYNVVSDNQYLTELNEYFRANSPLSYEEAIISTNTISTYRAEIVFSNKNKKTFLIFTLYKYKNENDWKIQNTTFGKR